VLVVPELVFPVDVFITLVDRIHAQAGRPSLGVSSWLRTSSKQLELLEQGRGVVRSLHLRGLALDLVGAPPALQAFQRGWIALGLDALPEGDHLHVELDGPVLRRLGLDFR